MNLRRTLTLSAAATALALTLTACGSSGHAMPMNSTPSAPGSSLPGSSMPGMDMSGPDTDGLSDTLDGYHLTGLPGTLPAGQDSAVTFRITGPDGKPVTAFATEQTKQLHFYAIRGDLTGFQHLHPSLAPDGTWTAPVSALQSGSWRFFTTFTPSSGPGAGKGYVLSGTATVGGQQQTVPLPAPTASVTTPDGYQVTAGTPGGHLMAGMEHQLTVTISKDGKPVTDLQPYLETYAHLTAFHAGDQAFAHLHPQTAVNGDHGGPELTFHAELPKPGDWRLFLQFQTGGRLHTAALTMTAEG
ncbi:hypothetical protein E6W39_09470 [Kitasatospora acidiphila]|uniref:Secreted protein n=1 Tax=Kitasatospora acidiphila TaxID=2567942 RepID=A0A540W0B4_9ACTN|nr:hypothetical protein [Kitasatospora acidiphila]TQF02459.1 hypothetical protein E6W39_09470 [Kitasatospora acidiphila]